jgi:hypothetical protein
MSRPEDVFDDIDPVGWISYDMSGSPVYKTSELKAQYAGSCVQAMFSEEQVYAACKEIERRTLERAMQAVSWMEIGDDYMEYDTCRKAIAAINALVTK